MTTKIDTSRLPTPGPHFIGRLEELSFLDTSWVLSGLENEPANTVVIVAMGGVGKSTLLAHWLKDLASKNWTPDERDPKANAVFVWSFYRQGTEERLASSDEFLEQTLRWFGDPNPTDGQPRERGERLAALVRRQRTLLILDGLEPLQEPPGPRGGRIKDQGVATLVRSLSLDNNGLLVISTRQMVDEIRYQEGGAVRRMNLERFSDDDGAALLSKLGVVGTEKERRRTSADYHGHALALQLLGSYLVEACGGEIRQLDTVDFEVADAVTQDGHAWRVIAAYENWLQSSELSVLRLLGFFDKPVSNDEIGVLRAEPVVQGLNDGIVGLNQQTWNVTISRLQRAGLLLVNDEGLDAHPLIRAYFAHHVERQHPNAWQDGHERLYEHYKNAAPELPETLEEMMPLYAAVVHGCKAGKYDEAFNGVYWPRIERGNEGYPTHKLGAFGQSLVAAGSFFVQRWTKVTPKLRDDEKAWLLNEAGFLLRGLGRLTEAVQPMETGIEFYKSLEDWENAAGSASNVSEISLTLGNVTRAVTSGEESVELGDRTDNLFERIVDRTMLAAALHQAGRLEDALATFRQAEMLQERWQPHLPRLYSLPGYQYCDLLLCRPGPRIWLALDDGVPEEFAALEEACESVLDRAKYALNVVLKGARNLLGISLNNLSLGRAYLGLSLSRSSHPEPAAPRAAEHLDEAVQGLRRYTDESYLPRGLLARAAFHRIDNERHRAEADLNEAEEIAERGGMLLHLADVHLERTVLHLQYDENDKARDRLDRAVALIEECSYGRRLRDVEYLEGVLAGR